MHGYKWPINCTRTRTAQASARLSPEELMAAVEKWAALAPSQLPYTTVADLDPAQIKSRQQGQELQELQPQLQPEPSPSPQQSISPGACGDIVYR